MSRHIIHGIDGQRWDLSLGEEVVIAQPGPSGLLGMPQSQVQAQQFGALAGQERYGARAEIRTGSIPVIINAHRPLAELRSIERRWWESWSVDQPCTYEVATKNAGSRYLDVYLQDDQGGDLPFDADHTGFYEATVNVVADDPYWRGNVLSFDFTPNRPPVDFYGRDKGQVAAFPGYFSPSVTKDEQSLFNPGDVPAPLRWSLQGPFTSFELTVDGRSVAGEFTVSEGQTLSVDSGARRVLLHDGVSSSNVTRRVSWGFADLPAGLAVPVGVLVNGTGRVRAEWTPKFRRAA